MELDFSKINQKGVGHRLRKKEMDGPLVLEKLLFEEFIPPYSSGTKSYSEVYENLRNEYDSLIRQQDSVTNGKRPIMLDVLVDATLQREAVRNSMDLIQGYYYLKDDNYLKN